MSQYVKRRVILQCIAVGMPVAQNPPHPLNEVKFKWSEAELAELNGAERNEHPLMAEAWAELELVMIRWSTTELAG